MKFRDSFYLILVLIVVVFNTSCKEKTVRKEHNIISREDIQTLPMKGADNDSSRLNKMLTDTCKKKLRILLIQCSNGYEYVMHGYDFNPILERELKKYNKFELVPFSYKKLMGVPYQGVYDKKYAYPILEKIDADIFIMTRFTGNIFPADPAIKEPYWGYEIKILNTKSMNQKVSIKANKLSDFKNIEIDIQKNISKLISDIEGI